MRRRSLLRASSKVRREMDNFSDSEDIPAIISLREPEDSVPMSGSMTSSSLFLRQQRRLGVIISLMTEQEKSISDGRADVTSSEFENQGMH